MDMIAIDINTYEGIIPEKYDLVCYEKGGDPIDGISLEGFDEVGTFDEFINEPAYCLIGGHIPTYCHNNRPYGDI